MVSFDDFDAVEEPVIKKRCSRRIASYQLALENNSLGSGSGDSNGRARVLPNRNKQRLSSGLCSRLPRRRKRKRRDLKPKSTGIHHREAKESRIVSKQRESCDLHFTDLTDDVLLLILEHLPASGLVNFSKTCKLFHRLCSTDTIWRYRCKVDFGLITKWSESSFIYLYEMFYKANSLRHDQNFFKPVSQLKTSVIVWYLINPDPPCHVVRHLTASQVKSIWGITEEELEVMYFNESERRPDIFPLCHYEWSKLYQVFLRKHKGVRQMQNYVLKRCLRNRQALEEHYKLSLHTSRRQKWYQYLEDRDRGNRQALRNLTEYMPKVTYVYLLHQITAMYIEGHLKGGFQTVQAYADFCGKFKVWMEEKSLKIWPPRHGDVLIQDYRETLDHVNKEFAKLAKEKEISSDEFLCSAKTYLERLHEVWIWQNEHGTSYRKEHRSSLSVRRNPSYRKYLARGSMENFLQLRLYFERKEILSHWLKENAWLLSLLGDTPMQSLQSTVCATDLALSLRPNDIMVNLVQRFLETGLHSDFNRIRLKLSEMANAQLHLLFKKARGLQDAIHRDQARRENELYYPDIHRTGRCLVPPRYPAGVYPGNHQYYRCLGL